MSEERPFVMPFGKYKGQQIAAVPDDYLAWCFGIARPYLQQAIAGELRGRGGIEVLEIPCRHCDGIAEGWCVRCGAPVCFRHIRQVGPETAYCIDHWDHWQLDERVKMPPEAAVRWADEHPTEASEYFARRKKLADRRAAREAAHAHLPGG
jgi:hypothetical protein